jgi:oligopeptidase B
MKFSKTSLLLFVLSGIIFVPLNLAYCQVGVDSTAAIVAQVVVEPPVARVEPHEFSNFGDTRVDNYHWLRGRDKEEVIDYLNAENSYTDEMMAGTTDLKNRLYDEFMSRMNETDLSVPVKDGDWFYYRKNEEGKSYRIYCRKYLSMDAEEEVYLDQNLLAEGHEYHSLGLLEISPDHKLIAYSEDYTGREQYELKFRDLTTGELLADIITDVDDLVWAEDKKTVFYTVPDEAFRSYKVMRHTLGTDTAEDVEIFTESDEKFSVRLGKSRDDKYILFSSQSNLTSEYWFVKAKKPTKAFKVFQAREHGIEYDIDHNKNGFFILTNEDAVNFKLMKVKDRKYKKKESWEEVVKHSDEILLRYFELFDNYLVIAERRNAGPEIRIKSFETGKSHYIKFDDRIYSCYFTDTPDFRGNLLRVKYSSFTTPSTVYDYNMETRKLNQLKQEVVGGGFDGYQYETRKIMATARDGSEIPVSMVFKKGIELNGENPLLLYGYGSYGHTMSAGFRSSIVSLLDRGMIYAIAHVRGSTAKGRMWYDDGKFLKKMNTFTDYIDCGEYLIETGYTKSEKMVGLGGSAGGLLIGAVVNMRPDLFKGVVAAVPFVDVVTTMLDASIPLTTGEYEEWGNPNEEEYYNYMKSYSPYDNVSTLEYPYILITAGLNDPRVQYWEPAKWAAKLRVFNKSDNLLLLKTNMGAGHGGASGRYGRYEETAFEYAFLLHILGITN